MFSAFKNAQLVKCHSSSRFHPLERQRYDSNVHRRFSEKKKTSSKPPFTIPLNQPRACKPRTVACTAHFLYVRTHTFQSGKCIKRHTASGSRNNKHFLSIKRNELYLLTFKMITLVHCLV